MEKFNVVISADGSCFGNPGPGGWAAKLTCGKHEKKISGYDPDTTNNKMEITAVIEALSVLKKPCNILFRLDSMYVAGLISGESKPKKNVQLWQELRKYLALHSYTVQYVPAHTGDPDNEWCDAEAKRQWKENFQFLKGAESNA